VVFQRKKQGLFEEVGKEGYYRIGHLFVYEDKNKYWREIYINVNSCHLFTF